MATLALWGVALVLGLVVWIRRGNAALKDAFGDVGERAVEIVPRLVMVVLVAGFAIRLLPSNFVAHTIGADSGFVGVLIAMLVGGLIPAGPSISFSLVVILNEAGAGIVQLITLITAWSVFAIHRLFIFELPMLGVKFTALRLISSLPLPLIAAAMTAAFVAIFPDWLSH